ncbi:MAG: hypothetical protein ACTHMC_09745 [Pseudobacter sp.]|uniref:hypothetical protein n=1 Tax=Pseudobacter sp. TaxID=2045420 RepID=UPI003F7CE548
MGKKTLPALHLAAASDNLRPALCHIEILDGIATATNGSILARLNLSEYSTLPDEAIRALNGKLIHRDVWQEIQDVDLIEVNGDVIHVENGGVKADYNIACEFQFPNYHSIIEAVAKSTFEKKTFVCFNPKHISIANKLFPGENLICRFYENNDMVVFFPSGDAKGFLGIMPIKITDEEATLDFTLS